jgi:GGDEF domain-containing protein
VPLWIAALERQIAAGGRFSLLLVELDGAKRLRLSEATDVADEAFERVASAVRRCIRRPDLLAHESEGRLWIVAAEAGRPGASALALRVAGAVEQAATLRGVPLSASVGVALYPDDARDAGGLADEAEESLFAARAEGVPVAGDGPDGSDGEPAVRGPWLVR